MKYICTIYT